LVLQKGVLANEEFYEIANNLVTALWLIIQSRVLPWLAELSRVDRI
jgi:hypothetical protein